MRIRFVGIDPGTGGDNCPAVFVDEETGAILFQGEVISDEAVLAETTRYSPLGAGEVIVKLPGRMKQIIVEAVDGGEGSLVQ